MKSARASQRVTESSESQSRCVQPITPFALSAYLDSLKAEGYTILLVREHLAGPGQ